VKADRHKTSMHGGWESDGSIVPPKRANKAESSAAESVEGRGPTKGNTVQTAADRTQSRASASDGLDGVRARAKLDNVPQRAMARYSTQGKSRMR